MKKNRLLAVALIVAFSTIATTGYSQLKFGLRGEVGLNKASFSEEALEVKNLNSFKLGPTVEVMLPAMNFGIEASLLYNNNKMEIREDGSVWQKVEETNHYIDIPVNLKYKFGLILPVKIYAAAGPYGRIHVGGGDDFKKISDDIKSKSFEAGINLGLGVELFKRLAVGVNYGIPLTDNYSADTPKWSDAFNNKDGLWSIQATVYL
ncbi:MAG: PorT family protein [Bacteroidales bacterium]|nr:PorT family protein [Bacteroidales bacterium]